MAYRKKLILGFALIPILLITLVTGSLVEPFVAQGGTVTVTVASGAVSGFSVVTFSPAFPVVPFVTPILRSGTSATAQFAVASVSFLALESAGQVWPNMPVAQTEIFGDNTHEVSLAENFTPLKGLNVATFSLDCSVPSFSNAVLRPMYSTDSGSTWNELSFNTAQLDVPVTLCNVGPIALTASIAAGVQTAAKIWLRVDGINGFGFGDAPAFNVITLTFLTSLSFKATCITQAKSVSSATIQCLYPITVASNIPLTVDWTAIVIP